MSPRMKRLLKQIEKYCERKGISVTQFGLLVANDGHLVRRMRAGRSPTLRTIERIEREIGELQL